MRAIVCFSGKMGSGKDTAANALTKLWGEEHGVKMTTRYNAKFSGLLKQSASILTGVPLSSDGDFSQESKANRIVKVGLGIDKSEATITLREFLQRFGTDCVRNVWPDFWAARLQQEIYRKISLGGKDSHTLVTITDCRFLNELKSVHELEDIFSSSKLLNDVKVLTVRLKGNPSGMVLPVIEHESETALDGHEDRFDLVINTEINGPDTVARIIMEKLKEG